MFELISRALGQSHLVRQGSIPLQPTLGTQFQACHGQKGFFQTLFGNVGRVADKVTGEGSLGGPGSGYGTPPPRYLPHNCWPWRICGAHTGKAASPAPSVSSHHARLQSSSSMSHAHFRPEPSPVSYMSSNPLLFESRSISQQYCSPTAPPGDYKPVANCVQLRTSTPNYSPPKSIDKLLEGLRHIFIASVCEPTLGATNDLGKRKQWVLGVLREQLGTPLALPVPPDDIANCSEYLMIREEVTRCLEVLDVKGLALVPELSTDGRELVVHVRCD